MNAGIAVARTAALMLPGWPLAKAQPPTSPDPAAQGEALYLQHKPQGQCADRLVAGRGDGDLANWFWHLLGIDLGDAPYPAILYGSVIFGVGLASIADTRAPRRNMGLLLLLACYESVAVLALLGPWRADTDG